MVTFWGMGVILFYGVSYFGFQRMRHCQGSLIEMFTPGAYQPCAGTTPGQGGPQVPVGPNPADCPPGYHKQQMGGRFGRTTQCVKDAPGQGQQIP